MQALDACQVPYQRCDHQAVFTVAEAAQVVPPMPGAKAKNLFLRDAHSARLFLVVVPYEKRVDLAALAATLGLRKLRFASAEELLGCLGVTAGAVSVLALFNDRDHRAELIMDESIAQANALQAHPLVNTATLSISMEGLKQFLDSIGHAMRAMEVPARD
jgi:Ala-tRNA(Pro) deacylase